MRPLGLSAVRLASPWSVLDRVRLDLADGARTTLSVATYDADQVRPRVVVLSRTGRLAYWCRGAGVDDAVVGGYFVREGGTPLGEVRVDGRVQRSVPFAAPWDERRACVHIDGTRVKIARRTEIERDPPGDLLQAGPLLIEDGASAVADNFDAEGFSAAAHQFDSDITVGRYPRSAFAVTSDRLMAAVCEGRADGEAGLTLGELADALVDIGAEAAINLDGGGSASLVYGGRLVNRPREEHGMELLGGRPVATALSFRPR